MFSGWKRARVKVLMTWPDLNADTAVSHRLPAVSFGLFRRRRRRRCRRRAKATSSITVSICEA